MDSCLRVGAAARLLGVTPHTLHDWERRGILPPALRHPANNYRLWPREEVLAAAERLQPRRPAGPAR